MKKPIKQPAVKKPPANLIEIVPSRIAKLTEREREVLQLFAHGHTYQETGEKLGMSPKTVGSYLQRVREKFRAKSKADLITVALAEGLLKAKSK